MAVELDNVAAFYKVAELGSFTKAAEALALSAPVISKRVSALRGAWERNSSYARRVGFI